MKKIIIFLLIVIVLVQSSPVFAKNFFLPTFSVLGRNLSIGHGDQGQQGDFLWGPKLSIGYYIPTSKSNDWESNGIVLKYSKFSKDQYDSQKISLGIEKLLMMPFMLGRVGMHAIQNNLVIGSQSSSHISYAGELSFMIMLLSMGIRFEFSPINSITMLSEQTTEIYYFGGIEFPLGFIN